MTREKGGSTDGLGNENGSDSLGDVPDVSGARDSSRDEAVTMEQTIPKLRQVEVLINSGNGRVIDVFDSPQAATKAKSQLISELRVALSRAGMDEGDIKFPEFQMLSKFIRE